MVDTRDLKSLALWACGFESRPEQKSLIFAKREKAKRLAFGGARSEAALFSQKTAVSREETPPRAWSVAACEGGESQTVGWGRC